jgi:uncharacterized protein YyaL (SSP411 family)
LRLKEDYDGAEPAASSVGAANLLTLSHLVFDGETRGSESHTRDFSEDIERTLRYFAARIAQSGRVVPMMLASLSTYHAGTSQLVIAGDPKADDTRALHDVARRRYLPTTIVVPLGPDHRDKLSDLLPWTASMKGVGGRATAYLCHNFACEAPTTDAGELAGLLDRK